jgi:hypothetical protein
MAADSLAQLNNVVQQLRGSIDMSGGYLRIVSSQPIMAWASKVENGTEDPSLQIATGAGSASLQVTSVASNAER